MPKATKTVAPSASLDSDKLVQEFLVLFPKVHPGEAVPNVRFAGGRFYIGSERLGTAKFIERHDALVALWDAQEAARIAEQEAAEEETDDAAQSDADASAEESSGDPEIDRLRAMGIGDPPTVSHTTYWPEELAAWRMLQDGYTKGVNKDNPDACFYVRDLYLGRESTLKHWAAYLSAAQGVVLQVVNAKTGEIAATYDGRRVPRAPDAAAARAAQFGKHKKEGEVDAEKKTIRKRVVGSMKPLDQQFFDLACRPEGVKRTELNKLNGGVVINWKGHLAALGKRRKRVIRVDKTGETPIYWLDPIA